MRILSGDPGKVNFALSVIDVKKKVKVVGTRMCANPVKHLHLDVVAESQAFLAELEYLNDKYGPFDGVCFERFQSRGLKGNTVETISLMLGLIAVFAHKHNIPVMFITASQWKNAFNKTMDLKGLYADYKLTSKKSPKAIHEFDACLQGLYFFYKRNNITPFAGMQPKILEFMQKFLESKQLAYPDS